MMREADSPLDQGSQCCALWPCCIIRAALGQAVAFMPGKPTGRAPQSRSGAVRVRRHVSICPHRGCLCDELLVAGTRETLLLAHRLGVDAARHIVARRVPVLRVLPANLLERADAEARLEDRRDRPPSRDQGQMPGDAQSALVETPPKTRLHCARPSKSSSRGELTSLRVRARSPIRPSTRRRAARPGKL